MTTPSNTPFNLQDILGGKLAESASQQLLAAALGGGAKKLGEIGLNHAKNMNVGDVLKTFEPFFEAQTQAAEPKPAKQSQPAPAPAAQEEVRVETPVVVIPLTKPAPADVQSRSEKSSKEANENIDVIHDIASTSLTSVEQDKLVTAVMNLVRLASPEGFTGEHVQWLSRLYGNKNI